MADEQLPDPPSDLKPEAQARWKQVIGDLAKRGKVDLETLQTYCQVWARWRNAEANIAKTGDLVKKDRGGVAANPLIAISNQAGAQVRSLEQRLGITREAQTDGRPGEPMSLRAYARRRGCSPESVSKAIKAERLLDSVVYIDGAPKIGDPDLADREWDENTDPSRKADKGGDDGGGSALVKASAEEKQWRAKSAELKFRKDAGELVDAKQLQAEYIDVCTTVRNKMLGLPNRMKQAYPDMPLEQLAALDAYIRESLEEIAGG